MIAALLAAAAAGAPVVFDCTVSSRLNGNAYGEPMRERISVGNPATPDAAVRIDYDVPGRHWTNSGTVAAYRPPPRERLDLFVVGSITIEQSRDLFVLTGSYQLTDGAGTVENRGVCHRMKALR